MAAAGLAGAAAPFLLGQQLAGAAVTSASDEQALTFVTFGGEAVTCTAGLYATHDTDVARQPELEWSTGLDGPDACRDDWFTVLTATYEDSQGVIRTTTYAAGEPTAGSTTGAYAATTVRADFHFSNCDSTRSATCDIHLAASPK